MSKSDEIAGITFENAFAISVMAISWVVDRIHDLLGHRKTASAVLQNGFVSLRRIKKQ
jgi:hypothetical protein